MREMSATTTVAGPRVTQKEIEDEIAKKPLQIATVPRSYTGKKSVTIEGFDFTNGKTLDKTDQKQMNVSDCESVVIRRCIFGNKTTKGQGLNIVGSKTKNLIIEYCIFRDMSFDDDNGGEPFRLGLSELSGCEFKCMIRKCIFTKLNADPETISLKTAKNVVEDCYFIDNKSNLTVRHGGLNVIQHNLFTGNGGSERNGVRLHGYGNVVRYNCFDLVDVPIMLRYGNVIKDPNWKDTKTPSGKKGSKHSKYAQTVNNVIQNNEFKDTNHEIRDLKKGDANLAPKNNTKKDNKRVEKFSFEQVGEEEEQPQPPTTEEFLTCIVDGVKDETVDIAEYTLCGNDKTKVDTYITSLKTPPPAAV